MDKNQVYIKTAAGEEAVRQRTRLVQRNLRNVLIMVDGYSTVGELGERFGDSGVVQAALQELEQAGFIETFERRIMREMGASGAMTSPLELPPEDTPPVSAEEAQPRARATETADIVTPEHGSLQDHLHASVPPLPQALAARVLAKPDEGIELPAIEALTLPPRTAAQTRPQAEAAPEAGSNGKWMHWLGRMKNAAKKERPPKEEKITIKPVRRGRRAVNWLGLAATLVIVLPLVAFLGLMLYPLDDYRGELERRLTEAMGRKVSIGRLAFAVSPRPRLQASDISIGGVLHAATAYALPDLPSLFAKRKTFKELSLERVDVGEGGVVVLGRLNGGTVLALERIVLAGASVAFDDARLEGVGGEIEFGASGAVSKIVLHAAEGRLKLELSPKGRGYSALLTVRNWTMPFAPGLTVESLDGSGELGERSLSLAKAEGRFYEGLLSGTGVIDWAGEVRVAGEGELRRANLAKLLPALSPEMGGEGELSAQLRFEAKAQRFDKLREGLRLSADYEIRRGRINRIDLAEAVRSGVPTRGGDTKFEQLSGSLTLVPQSQRLSDLRLLSGLMRATGAVAVGKNKQLDGAMTVEIRGSASVVRSPVIFGGTLADPVLSLNRNAGPH
ncbi:MAG: hypothetical protein AB1768_13765 [Pseudomonadota bacterium]